jgi:hypothetical protein
MDLDRFEVAAQQAFEYLERDYGLEFHPDTVAERREHWWVRYLTYQNDRVFVRVELDDRDRAFNVLFGPVRNGVIPPYPIVLERDDEPIEWFPLWAVLHARDAPEPPFSFVVDERLDAELRAWGRALEAHAADALRSGDFSSLDQPVRRVKRQQYQQYQSGRSE